MKSLANVCLYIHIFKGVRNIIYNIDCNVQLLNSKQAIKQHYFAVSNAFYKLRSRMPLIQQKGLKIRAQLSIQASYD